MYTFDSKSIFKSGSRWFPIMGEIHYSRYPKEFWKESLYKMKAGGVDIVSAYVIWIHHEEIEGQYDFTGDRDLHGFVQACKDCGMKLLLRIGPWSHGEVRNGGFPDWLLKKDFEVRTNDENYFATVEKWYKKIYSQVSDFICAPDSEDNTIIGVQIENEYGHCGGLWDESGEDHMKRLYKIACDIGFKVPLYTATGWGGARTGGLLPVMGGYCDAPWDQRITEIEPSGNYIFTYERNDHNIGSDYGLGEGITFDVTKFPYLTAELGGGLQVTKHRRTIAKASDIGAVSLVKLGSGVNLLGYYMYHGGTNPEGKLTTLQESKETGYPNDLPVKSYDFRAPVREYGQVSETLKELKLYSYFVHDFCEEICSTEAKIPEDNPLMPADTDHLRYSFREAEDGSGFLFINNYVRLKKMADHKAVKIKTPDGKIEFPTMDIKDKEYFFLPYNLKIEGAVIKTALCTPFCKLSDGTTVFYTHKAINDVENLFEFSQGSFETAKILVISREDALNAWKTQEGNLVITTSDSCVLPKEKGIDEIAGRGKLSYRLYAADKKEFVAVDLMENPVEKSLPKNIKVVEVDSSTYSIDLSPLCNAFSEGINDCFVNIDYKGESAELYAMENGKRTLIADNFFLGDDYSWEIGLKKFLNRNIDFSTLELKINALEKDAKIYFEKWPQISGEKLCSLKNISVDYEWKVELKK